MSVGCGDPTARGDAGLLWVGHHLKPHTRKIASDSQVIPHYPTYMDETFCMEGDCATTWETKQQKNEKIMYLTNTNSSQGKTTRLCT